MSLQLKHPYVFALLAVPVVASVARYAIVRIAEAVTGNKATAVNSLAARITTTNDAPAGAQAGDVWATDGTQSQLVPKYNPDGSVMSSAQVDAWISAKGPGWKRK